MEVRFRPLQPSTLARHVTPGQSPSEEGQDFLEVVESLAGAEQTPGENANSDRNKQEPSQQRNWTKDSASADFTDDVQEDVDDSQGKPSREHTVPAPSKSIPEDKPLGTRIDMTA